MFSYEFCEIFKNTFFHKTPLMDLNFIDFLFWRDRDLTNLWNLIDVNRIRLNLNLIKLVTFPSYLVFFQKKEAKMGKGAFIREQ